MKSGVVGKITFVAGSNSKKSTTRGEPLVRVFDFLDYREYLRAAWMERKAIDPKVSVRYIAAKVGFKSASYFTQVLKGRTGMTPSMALRFAAFLRLDRREADYLELLVLHARSRTAADRRRYLERLAGFRESVVRTVPPEQYEFYAAWHHTAIRELLHIEPFRGDHKALATRLRPAIAPAQARESIQLLLRLGMAREENGAVRRADARSTTTGEAVRSVQVDQFHQACLDLARASIDGIPREERSLSTLTVTLSAAGRERALQEIARARRQILSIAESDSGETEVYHLGMQFFPMTGNGKERAP
jgi:uncharacterized protein (TIGR02147 family)